MLFVCILAETPKFSKDDQSALRSMKGFAYAVIGVGLGSCFFTCIGLARGARGCFELESFLEIFAAGANIVWCFYNACATLAPTTVIITVFMVRLTQLLTIMRRAAKEGNGSPAT